MKPFDELKRLEPGLEYLGIRNIKKVHWNLCSPKLYEQATKRGEGVISHLGPLVVVRPPESLISTGRAPDDKYIVRDDETEKKINWGNVNIAFDTERFEDIFERVKSYMQDRELFIQDVYAGADPKYRLAVRVITEYAWQSLFARNVLIRIRDRSLIPQFRPEFTVIAMSKFLANPKIDGIHSETFILVNFSQKLVLIGGTYYGGEIKKSIFTALNYILPQKNVLSMHCSANMGKSGDTALLFGLSGTGKTTLSADPKRALLGDDEHGWSNDGIFNFEGGCYAKVIRLSREAEPEIYETTRKFGTILENVVCDPETRYVDLDDDSITENTRAAYPLTHLDNIVKDGMGGHPKNIIFLTADAFGVLPPISRLTIDQATYHFLSGYTAKVAGTEAGVTEPKATFSACFGAPFMPLHPSEYGRLLAEKINKQKAQCWLINTGWTGGPYGVGKRIAIRHTRSMLNAALEGRLDGVNYVMDPIFRLGVPESCPDVPQEILTARNTWADKAAYDEKARNLAGLFAKNFQKYENFVSPDVIAAGPKA